MESLYELKFYLMNIAMSRSALFFTLSFLLICTNSAFILLSDNLVKRKTKTGEVVEVEISSEGKINLYFKKVKGDVLPFEEAYAPHLQFKKLYYIGPSNSWIVEEINEKNYRFRLKAYTKDCPDLRDKIGSRGYRFGDIQHIVEEYNKTFLANN